MNHKDTKADVLSRKPLGVEVEQAAHAVIGGAIEVHSKVGPGFLESVYEEAMAIELAARRIPFKRQAAFGLEYKGQRIGEGRMDLLVNDCLVVELKAVDDLAPIHFAQAISYLRATGHRLALLINFNVPILKQGIRRVVL
jgi:GxxExxY protein